MTDRESNPVTRNILARYQRGDDVLVDPMDYVLLDNLAEEGTMFAGAYPDGPTSVELSDKLFERKIPAAQIAPRLTLLRIFGLAVTLNRRGVHDKVWQITPEGERVLAEWKKRKAAEQ